MTRLVLAATGPGRHAAVPAAPEATAALLGRGAGTPAEAYRLACTVLYSPRFQRDHPEFIARRSPTGRRTRSRVAPSPRSSAPRATPTSAAVSGRSRSRRLVLHGTEDVLVPLANAETLTKLIPGARRYWFDGCGHLFFHEDSGAHRRGDPLLPRGGLSGLLTNG